MTAHKHAAMIKAKVDNMDLVVFVKPCDNGAWYEKDCSAFQFWEDSKYFLCLPQHKEACLHWLNGGLTQVKYDGEDWKDVFNSENPSWQGCNYFMMRDYVDYRIKPRKEKRWIAVKGYVTSNLYEDRRQLELMYATAQDVQIIEIEV